MPDTASPARKLDPDLQQLITQVPKVELHLHIEGSLEPELMFELARRNDIALPFASIDEVRAAYAFSNLQSFLDIYYEGAKLLQTRQDFHDLTWAYLERAKADGIVHTEIFCDPQTHTERGIDCATVIEGITSALRRAEDELSITSRLIPCFLRHLSEQAALECFEQLMPLRDSFVAVGLDSSEQGHPPEKFAKVFAAARSEGLRTVAHAGEEGPPSYITGALDSLRVDRIDHGVRCLEDPALVERLVRENIHLTVCPLSNLALRVVDKLEDHPLARMLERGLSVGINADDPAYFGGYCQTNYEACAGALELSAEQIVKLAANAIDGSFLDESDKARHRATLARLSSAC